MNRINPRPQTLKKKMLITNKKCENETNKKIGNSVDVIDTQAVWRQSILKKNWHVKYLWVVVYLW